MGLGAIVVIAIALVLWWPRSPTNGNSSASNSDSVTKQPAPPTPAASPPETTTSTGPLRKLDPNDKGDLSQAKVDAAKLLKQAVGGEAGAVEIGGYPKGFAIELRFTIASLDKQRIHDALAEIYRTLADKFPGPIMQAQVIVFYITGYKNGQPLIDRLVTTFMRDKLYQKSWGACPWQSPFYDHTQAQVIPCLKEARQ